MITNTGEEAINLTLGAGAGKIRRGDACVLRTEENVEEGSGIHRWGYSFIVEMLKFQGPFSACVDGVIGLQVLVLFGDGRFLVPR